MPEAGGITIQNARLVYRNFAGKKGQFNAEGARSFSVVLDEDLAQVLTDDGWNVKSRPGRDEGEGDFHTLKVKVNYDSSRPPRVILVSSRGRTTLDEETVGLADQCEIEKADLIIRPYHWSMADGESGISAYLKSLFITVVEDELDLKYADVPEIGQKPPQQWDMLEDE